MVKIAKRTALIVLIALMPVWLLGFAFILLDAPSQGGAFGWFLAGLGVLIPVMIVWVPMAIGGYFFFRRKAQTRFDEVE